ncbi:hypothetical protein FG93_00215 [Bosea sp. LC85]|nr:hypothetical protein FG93_00215 [Bosea sp. LC85]
MAMHSATAAISMADRVRAAQPLRQGRAVR